MKSTKEMEFITKMNHIDPEYIENAAKPVQKKKSWKAPLITIAACAVLVFGVFMMTGDTLPTEYAIAADVIVNIEGIITEVGEDGLSFRLDNGQWVTVTDTTEIGAGCVSEEAKSLLFFEPTFRVGNSITGFAENPEDDRITAYAIYNNWNWEDPIR